jgi:hypothetical protein
MERQEAWLLASSLLKQLYHAAGIEVTSKRRLAPGKLFGILRC